MISEPYCTEAEADEYFSTRLNADEWQEADIIEVSPTPASSIRMTDEDGNVVNLTILEDGGQKAISISETTPTTPSLVTRKYKALVTASNAIDLLAYRGEVTDEDQDREFPRNGSTEIPKDIKRACAEEALSLLQGNDPGVLLSSLSLASKSFDGASIAYDKTAVPAHILAGITSGMAWSLLLPYLRDIRSIRFDRG